MNGPRINTALYSNGGLYNATNSHTYIVPPPPPLDDAFLVLGDGESFLVLGDGSSKLEIL